MEQQKVYTPDSASRIALKIGSGIIECGGEVSRAEDSAKRAALAMGMTACEVFALNSFFLITVCDGSGKSITVSRRIKVRSTDLGKLEYINELSRELCDGSLEAIKAELMLDKYTPVIASTVWSYAVSMAVCAVFTLFFGGGAREAIVAAIGASVTVWLKRTAKNGFGNPVIFTFICSFASGICGVLLVLAGVAENYAVIAKGDIMLLVPGLSLVCAGRDIIGGDLLTGLLSFIETALIAMALAAGFALPEILLAARG